MPSEYRDTDQFRGARVQHSDLSRMEIRDCVIADLRLVDCYGGSVSLSGEFDRVIVNDVDVADFVQDELDRHHPARQLAREATTVDDYRETWGVLDAQWAATVERVRRLPPDTLNLQVQGEWSFIETLRHLLFASDAWLGNSVLEEDQPYHPLGYPAGGTTPEEMAPYRLTIDAEPTLDEVLAARQGRTSSLRDYLERLDEAELDRVCSRKPGPAYPDREYVVRRCLSVILNEEAEHHRYALRDLAVIEAAQTPEGGVVASAEAGPAVTEG